MKHFSIMKQNRDFHRQVRVVYRACRKLYGKEKAQDECLKVFKVVFPEYYRLKNSDNIHADVPKIVSDRISKIVSEWNPTGELKSLTDKVIGLMEMPFGCKREELIQFYEDITPVVMRIRKLTPRECFRLMDVDEKDIEKIQESGISNSAQYKLAGNSVVVSCMYYLFKKLFIDNSPEYTPGEPIQLSLF